ncbi:MAG: acyl carrier protein [Alphaproteobacteria bacterium]|nr:acyl carrier protein [Alphaproteobacteria bacterium]
MNKQDILDQLTEVFHDIFDDESITISPQTTAEDVDGWDSFNHINLIVATEMKFKIKFRAAETEELKNVGGLVDLIAAKLNVAS